MYGQLGDGSVLQRLSPVQVFNAPGLPVRDAVAISVANSGTQYQDAVGGVYVWGQNSVGQLGFGNTVDLRYPALRSGGMGMAGGWTNVAYLGALASPTAITADVQSAYLAAGGSATLSVTATGTNLAYQWFKDGTAIPGANSSTLTVGVSGGAGTYYAAIRGRYDTV